MKSDYFKIRELVPLELYNLVDEEVLWRMIPLELIHTMDYIKEKFKLGTCTINSYAWGQDRNWSGLRLKNRPYYSETSQHTKFNALDMVFTSYNSKDIRDDILAYPEEYPHIGGLEMGVSWLHFDIRPRTNGKINLFYS